jgi:RNA polymerase sigma factor (sigma-70 family)
VSKEPARTRRALTTAENELVRGAVPLAELLARKMAKKRPALAYADYLSLAYEALCDAVLLYDASKGAFSSYAWAGVVGAMYDGLAKHLSEQPERLVSRLFGLKAADAGEDRAADPFEDSDEDKLARARQRARKLTFGVVTGLSCATWRELGEDGLMFHDAHVQAVGQLDRTREELLVPEESKLLDLHFEAGLPWVKVAAALGVSEGAAKSRATRILKRLEAELTSRNIEAAPSLEGR